MSSPKQMPSSYLVRNEDESRVTGVQLLHLWTWCNVVKLVQSWSPPCLLWCKWKNQCSRFTTAWGCSFWTNVFVWLSLFSRTSETSQSGCVNDCCSCAHETHFIQQTADCMTSCSSVHLHHSDHTHTFFTSSLVTHLKPFGSPRNLPSWPPERQLYTTQQLPSPPLLNGCGWDGVKVITGPWIFVSTHFISVRLPTGKSMSSSLMKDLHLCPMGLLVFILSPNMVSMKSPETVAHVSYSMGHWCIDA